MLTNLDNIGSNLNLATNIRWIACINFQKLYPELKSKNINFNLQSWELPEQTLGTTEVSYMGYQIEIPTYLKPYSKSITFEYLLPSDLRPYKYLYSWMNKCTVEAGTGAGSPKLADFILPVKVVLLSEFKKVIMSINFENCWVKNLAPIRLDYRDNEGSVITHSFTLSYSSSSITDNENFATS